MATEPVKLNNVLNGMPSWVKVFAYFGAPMLFAMYFAAKDAGYIGATTMHAEHRAIVQVLERLCVRTSTTNTERSECLFP